MKRVRQRFPARGLVAATALLLAGCGGSVARQEAPSPEPTPPTMATGSRPAPDGGRAVALDLQDLRAPLLEGQRLLTSGLPAASADSFLLRWEPDGIGALEEPLRFAHLMQPSVLVIWRLRDEGLEEAQRWFCFDPARIRMRPLPSTIDERGQTRATVVRSLPRPVAGGQDPGDGVFALDLQLEAERVRPGKPRLVAGPGGSCAAPLLLGEDRVAFLHRPLNGAEQRLLIAALAGDTPPEDALPQLRGDVQALERGEEGMLRFAADADGWYRPYRLRLRDMQVIAGSGAAPPPRGSEAVLMAARYADGRLQPQLLRLPDRFDLDTLLALVAAHNPLVNRERALLAAALADAGGIATPSWPAAFGAALPSDDRQSRILVEGLGRGMTGILPVVDEQLLPADLRDRLRLQLLRGRLESTLDRQQAALCEAWFQARAGEELLRVDDALVAVLAAHHQALQARHRAGSAVVSEVMAAARTLDEAREQQRRHRQRVDFHLASISRLCDLPPEQPLRLAAGGYRFDQLPGQDDRRLHELALLNNPRLQAARLNLGRGFSTLPEGDTNGLPLSTAHDGGDSLDALLQAMRLQAAGEGERVARAVAEGLERYREVRRAWAVQRQHVAWALEQVRLARLYERYPLVDTEQKRRSQGLRAERARYYRQLAEQLRQEADLGTSFTQLWRAVGSIEALNDHLNSIADERIAKRFPSLWLWDSRRVLRDRATMERFLETAAAYDVKQIYCYLPAEDNPLDDRLLSERLTILINRCAARRISVWALLGERDWLTGGGSDYFRRSLDAVLAYNRGFDQLEPRLAGVKIGLRLERHPAWNGPVAEQGDVAARWLELARQARAGLPPEMPLWIDCPADLFEPQHRHLAEELLGISDGLSVICSDRDQGWILKTADRILADWPGLLEIGVELEGSTEPADLRALCEALVAAHGNAPGFTGVALHDWTGLLPPASDD